MNLAVLGITASKKVHRKKRSKHHFTLASSWRSIIIGNKYHGHLVAGRFFKAPVTLPQKWVVLIKNVCNVRKKWLIFIRTTFLGCIVDSFLNNHHFFYLYLSLFRFHLCSYLNFHEFLNIFIFFLMLLCTIWIFTFTVFVKNKWFLLIICFSW